MRRGRATLPHPGPQRDDSGRTLVSRHIVAHLLQLHVDMVRRAAPSVACHVPTRVHLVDMDEAEKALTGKTRRTAACR